MHTSVKTRFILEDEFALGILLIFEYVFVILAGYYIHVCVSTRVLGFD